MVNEIRSEVNDNKTELCLFYRNFQGNITITVNGNIIKSKSNMDILGVSLDSKLSWANHVPNAITKTNRELHCIRQIKQFFNTRELSQLITSIVYSILNYNAEIWNISSLNHRLIQQLMTASVNALKICTPTYHYRMSYSESHSINNRATPIQMGS